MFYSSKRYGHDAGFSCAFRQWRASSHCNKLHGYALAIRVEWEAVQLDDRQWVVDFGSLAEFKKALVAIFDHVTIVAKDDPHLDWFIEARKKGIIDLVIVEHVGCEQFAKLVFNLARDWTRGQPDLEQRVRVYQVTINEHDGNSATYRA